MTITHLRQSDKCRTAAPLAINPVRGNAINSFAPARGPEVKGEVYTTNCCLHTLLYLLLIATKLLYDPPTDSPLVWYDGVIQQQIGSLN